MHGPSLDELLVWYEGAPRPTKPGCTSIVIRSYGPYGELNIATGICFRYAGQQFLGSLNLYYYKARFYSPALVRFLQIDPIGTADDLNLYA